MDRKKSGSLFCIRSWVPILYRARTGGSVPDRRVGETDRAGDCVPREGWL